ncbi:MAG: hypothetical protein IPO21_07815 [Bacteroidales bacterium]|nr:hypothetical protein [Bacteroidales bacterium]
MIDLNFIADSFKFDSFRNIEITSVNSKFVLLVFYNAEKNWSIKTITLTDTQLQQVHDLPIDDSWTINSITLKIAPNDKYFVYEAEKEDGNHEIWLGEIYEENGYFKTKVRSLAVFEYINDIEFSRDGNILALKVNYKNRDWFAFKDISSLHD